MKQHVGIAGAGSMGSGIAQVAATNGNSCRNKWQPSYTF